MFRCAFFLLAVACAEWIFGWDVNVMLVYIDGQDDMHIRVYNYNTLERVHQFEAHSDYVRSITVHPTQTFILTSSGM